MAFLVEVEKKKETFIISPKGSLDSVTYRHFEDKVHDVLGELSVAVVVNMEEVDYVSSMGLSALLKTKKKVEQRGGKFVLTNLRPSVKKVFEVAHLLPDIIAFKSVVEADMYLDKVQKGIA